MVKKKKKSESDHLWAWCGCVKTLRLYPAHVFECPHPDPRKTLFGPAQRKYIEISWKSFPCVIEQWLLSGRCWRLFRRTGSASMFAYASPGDMQSRLTQIALLSEILGSTDKRYSTYTFVCSLFHKPVCTACTARMYACVHKRNGEKYVRSAKCVIWKKKKRSHHRYWSELSESGGFGHERITQKPQTRKESW